MQIVDQYFLNIRSKITEIGFIDSESVVFEKFGRNIGRIQGKIFFRDASVLEFLEMIVFSEEKFERPRYRFHWQDGRGKLIVRWDNAKHHPEMPTYPHHKHVLSEDKIKPSESIGLIDVLDFISEHIGRDIK